jgi:hypothetical protein
MGKPPAPARTYAWWLVLALVGLDYFSSLAYLPSIVVRALGDRWALAPLVALAVVAVTLFAAVPVYAHVVRRSPHGEGASGLLERLVRGWFGKTLILVLLGFVATDFVITRTLSFADASAHLVHNPTWQRGADHVIAHKESIRSALPSFLQGRFFNYWDEKLVLTVVLLIGSFAFYWFVQVGLTPRFLRVAAIIVSVYLALNAVVIGCGLAHVLARPELWERWVDNVHAAPKMGVGFGTVGSVVLVALKTFPQLALGLSGFELSMATAPLVRGRPDDNPQEPRGRIRWARVMILVAALIMSTFIVGSVLVVTLLVPVEAFGAGGSADHRALAWIAHGGNGAVSPLFGEMFGSVYDLSSVLILFLAGASATLSLRDLVPRYLAKYGMQLQWAAKVGIILHLFNVVILLVTIVFRADVQSQQSAYAASVLVLLTAASIAAYLDVRHRWRGSIWRPAAVVPFGLIATFFLSMAVLTTVLNSSGLVIALAFVATVLTTGFASRWFRSTELRFEGFVFQDDVSKQRWEAIRELEFQVLVPHRPGRNTLADKEAEIRRRHRLTADVPIIFIEAEVGDPSDFLQQPLMKIDREDGREIIRVSCCASVAHVLAAIALEFRHIGRPPELIFGWSEESPLAANLSFLLMGRGNVPWMVHDLIRRAEPDPVRRPRVLIG